MADTHDALRVYFSEVASVWPLPATIRQKNGAVFDLLRTISNFTAPSRLATASSHDRRALPRSGYAVEGGT